MTCGRVLVVLGCLGLVACAAAGAGTPAASPTPTTNLAAEYTELVKPPNDAGDRLRAASTDPAATVGSLRPTAQAFLDSVVQLNKDLIVFQDQAATTVRSDLGLEDGNP